MEPVVSVDTIAEIRARLAADLPHSCDIQTDDSVTVAGAQRPNWTSADWLTPCKLVTVGAGSDALRADQNQGQEQSTVRFAVDVSVSVGQRLVVTGEDPITGAPFSRTLTVTSIPTISHTAKIVRVRDVTTGERVG